MVVISRLTLAILLASAPAAAEWTLTLDPESTEIEFALKATAHTVHGSFELQSGRLDYDPATGKLEGEIRVDARTGDTENKKRDRKMHGSVLESEQYPVFALRTARIDGALAPAGSSEVRIHGTLVIHGTEHDVSWPATVVIDGNRCRIETSFSIPYVEWGMEDPSVFVLRVAKSVEVTVRAEGTLGNLAPSG